jgi:hypothetical protein
MAKIEIRLGFALLLALAPACGGGETATLTIANEQGDAESGLEITSVLVRDCITRYWEPNAPPFDPVRDRPAEGVVTISHGESRDLELSAGCHDIVATRENLNYGYQTDRSASARVVLGPGESAIWIPWRVTENGSWW